jgi:acetyl-CoA carboxylase biotin carboxyl carrier protein
MKIDEIRELILLFDKTSIAELDVQKQDYRLSLRKSAREKESVKDFPLDINQKEELSNEKENDIAEKETVEVLAPMVATFYKAASPDAAPYVEIGDYVEIGQTLCILEAMKLMNEIRSEISGTIIDILVDNAEPVEYGQVLFLIERD